MADHDDAGEPGRGGGVFLDVTSYKTWVASLRSQVDMTAWQAKRDLRLPRPAMPGHPAECVQAAGQSLMDLHAVTEDSVSRRVEQLKDFLAKSELVAQRYRGSDVFATAGLEAMRELLGRPAG